MEQRPQPGISRDELLRQLREMDADIQQRRDWEADHGIADRLLLAYINDPEISEAFDKVGRWYA